MCNFSVLSAFAISIEAKYGVTTGISAADRARTIVTAIDARNGADQLVSPGHVFPLVARPGGVLVRAGHTEAAVDVARLAGLSPSGVICEIMREDGSMARLSDLLPFAKVHGLKVGTIRDLIGRGDVAQTSRAQVLDEHRRILAADHLLVSSQRHDGGVEDFELNRHSRDECLVRPFP